MSADKLYIICGHGAGDPGSSGGGKNEADLVRKLASRMAALGGSRVEVLDTTKNWYASNLINSSLKSKVGRNPVVELHMDAAGSTARGGHVIIKSGFKADEYDNAIASYLKAAFPGRSETIVKRNDLANVKRAASNNINYRLVEVCFITNDADRTKFIDQMDSVATGLLNAFGIGTTSKSSGWVKDSKGWWYQNADGSWPRNAWQKIDGKWYWFDDGGYAVHDRWLELGGIWYYFDSSCAALQSTCAKIDGKWYAFNSLCYMLTSVKVNSGGDLAL